MDEIRDDGVLDEGTDVAAEEETLADAPEGTVLGDDAPAVADAEDEAI